MSHTPERGAEDHAIHETRSPSSDPADSDHEMNVARAQFLRVLHVHAQELSLSDNTSNAELTPDEQKEIEILQVKLQTEAVSALWDYLSDDQKSMANKIGLDQMKKGYRKEITKRLKSFNLGESVIQDLLLTGDKQESQRQGHRARLVTLLAIQKGNLTREEAEKFGELYKKCDQGEEHYKLGWINGTGDRSSKADRYGYLATRYYNRKPTQDLSFALSAKEVIEFDGLEAIMDADIPKEW